MGADLSKRYGNLKDGAHDILKHKWFSTLDFTKLEKYETPSPFKPAMKDEMDVSNFEDIPDSGDVPPTVLLNKGHGKPVDWWTLGILIYEMIVGQPPFCDEDPMGIYQKILAGKVYFPKYFDKNAKALVKKLLTADLSKRYGNLKDGANDILKHKWFSTLDFQDLEALKTPSPYKPAMKDDQDVSNFEDIPDSAELPPAVAASQDPF